MNDTRSNDWTYYDFVVPIRRGNKSPLTKKVILFLIVQLITTFILWGLIGNIIGDNSGLNSAKGEKPLTIFDLSVFLIWLGLARISWYFFHK